MNHNEIEEMKRTCAAIQRDIARREREAMGMGEVALGGNQAQGRYAPYPSVDKTKGGKVQGKGYKGQGKGYKGQGKVVEPMVTITRTHFIDLYERATRNLCQRCVVALRNEDPSTPPRPMPRTPSGSPDLEKITPIAMGME